MDPSLTNWGLAATILDLETGMVDLPVLTLVSPKKAEGKQVRVNSSDLHIASQLAEVVIPACRAAKAIFVEIPVGSQSARAMASYGVCVGILGAVRSLGVPLIEVTAKEVKKALSGKAGATKEEMIQAALREYPDANHPSHNGKVTQKAEHTADALGAIHAGVNTPTFQQLMRLFQEV